VVSDCQAIQTMDMNTLATTVVAMQPYVRAHLMH